MATETQRDGEFSFYSFYHFLSVGMEGGEEKGEAVVSKLVGAESWGWAQRAEWDTGGAF